MTKYQENFIYTTSFIKKLLRIKIVTLLLGHPVPRDFRISVSIKFSNKTGLTKKNIILSNSKMERDQVPNGESVLGQHVTSISNVPWKLLDFGKRFRFG